MAECRIGFPPAQFFEPNGLDRCGIGAGGGRRHAASRAADRGLTELPSAKVKRHQLGPLASAPWVVGVKPVGARLE